MGREGIRAVADALHADPGEDLGAERDRRGPQRLHVGQRPDRMSAAIVIATGRPDRIGDLVEEFHHIVGADGTLAEPAFRRGAVVEPEGVVDAEGHGKRFGVLTEVFARVAGADLRGAGIIKVGVRVGGIALRLDRLAIDEREEHRFLRPHLAVEDAIKRM